MSAPRPTLGPEWFWVWVAACWFLGCFALFIGLLAALLTGRLEWLWP